MLLDLDLLIGPACVLELPFVQVHFYFFTCDISSKASLMCVLFVPVSNDKNGCFIHGLV